MNLIPESHEISDYLKSDKYVDFYNPNIKLKAKELFKYCMDEAEKVRVAFEFVRDAIPHSWDIKSARITRTASEVLHYGEGICYAKSLLLAALLRSAGIPTGFCYQRLTLGSTPDTGYVVHALNAVYLAELDRWIRLDARGSTTEVNPQFSVKEDMLEFPVRPEYEEFDYPTVYIAPHPVTMETLELWIDCSEMYQTGLPTKL